MKQMKKNIKIKNIYGVIKDKRIKLGISQAELAAMSGIDRRVINNWEKAYANKSRNLGPSALYFLKVCDVLNLNMSDFIDTKKKCKKGSISDLKRTISNYLK